MRAVAEQAARSELEQGFAALRTAGADRICALETMEKFQPDFCRGSTPEALREPWCCARSTGEHHSAGGRRAGICPTKGHESMNENLPDRCRKTGDKNECVRTHSGMGLFWLMTFYGNPTADVFSDGMRGAVGTHVPEGQHQIGLCDDLAVPDQRSPPSVCFIIGQIFGQRDSQGFGSLPCQLIHLPHRR